jgi:hypothetical protein
VIRPLAVRPSGRRLLDNPSGWPASHGCILVFAPRSKTTSFVSGDDASTDQPTKWSYP